MSHVSDTEDSMSIPESAISEAASRASHRHWTIPRLITELKKKGIRYSASARKAELYRLLFPETPRAPEPPGASEDLVSMSTIQLSLTQLHATINNLASPISDIDSRLQVIENKDSAPPPPAEPEAVPSTSRTNPPDVKVIKMKDPGISRYLLHLFMLILTTGLATSTGTSSFWKQKAIVFSKNTIGQIPNTEIPELSEFTACLDIFYESDTPSTAFSYCVQNGTIPELGFSRKWGMLEVFHLGKVYKVNKYLEQNAWHTVCINWKRQDKQLVVYVNATHVYKATTEDGVIKGNGSLVLGAEHTNIGGRINIVSISLMSGELYNYQMWNYTRSQEQLLDCIEGNLLSWTKDALRRFRRTSEDVQLRCANPTLTPTPAESTTTLTTTLGTTTSTRTPTLEPENSASTEIYPAATESFSSVTSTPRIFFTTLTQKETASKNASGNLTSTGLPGTLPTSRSVEPNLSTEVSTTESLPDLLTNSSVKLPTGNNVSTTSNMSSTYHSPPELRTTSVVPISSWTNTTTIQQQATDTKSTPDPQVISTTETPNISTQPTNGTTPQAMITSPTTKSITSLTVTEVSSASSSSSSSTHKTSIETYSSPLTVITSSSTPSPSPNTTLSGVTESSVSLLGTTYISASSEKPTTGTTTSTRTPTLVPENSASTEIYPAATESFSSVTSTPRIFFTTLTQKETASKNASGNLTSTGLPGTLPTSRSVEPNLSTEVSTTESLPDLLTNSSVKLPTGNNVSTTSNMSSTYHSPPELRTTSVVPISSWTNTTTIQQQATDTKSTPDPQVISTTETPNISTQPKTPEPTNGTTPQAMITSPTTKSITSSTVTEVSSASSSSSSSTHKTSIETYSSPLTVITSSSTPSPSPNTTLSGVTESSVSLLGTTYISASSEKPTTGTTTSTRTPTLVPENSASTEIYPAATESFSSVTSTPRIFFTTLTQKETASKNASGNLTSTGLPGTLPTSRSVEPNLSTEVSTTESLPDLLTNSSVKLPTGNNVSTTSNMSSTYHSPPELRTTSVVPISSWTNTTTIQQQATDTKSTPDPQVISTTETPNISTQPKTPEPTNGTTPQAMITSPTTKSITSSTVTEVSSASSSSSSSTHKTSIETYSSPLTVITSSSTPSPSPNTTLSGVTESSVSLLGTTYISASSEKPTTVIFYMVQIKFTTPSPDVMDEDMASSLIQSMMDQLLNNTEFAAVQITVSYTVKDGDNHCILQPVEMKLTES
ncbi:mucin-5AC-like [Bufo gargarizans]|uniref:mucin-5AC-like n=1 Tax=Bufo gargarizans TaxID=30331 RepID=UPI001CF5FA92|nr:mucin-5AC-like [Bufo gargarizans]